MSYTVSQNVSFLTIASVLQRAISFVYFIFIARLIGVGNTGSYFFAITFTTIFGILADFGINAVLTRESSRFPEKINDFVNTVFWTRIIMGAVVYLLAITAVNILGYSELIKHLVYLSGITMFFDNLHPIFYSIFRAKKNLVYESFGIIGSQFLTLVIGSLALWLKWPLYWLIIAYAIPSTLNTLYIGLMAWRSFSIKIKLIWKKEIFSLFLSQAWPFAIAGIVGRFYSYSDSIIMSKMLTVTEIGWWSVPYKIVFAFQFIPSALSASIYPAMSAYHINEKEKNSDLFQKSYRYLFTIVLPLAAGLIALSTPFIIKIYGSQYAPAVPVLQILSLSLVFGFFTFVNGALLNASNRQTVQTTLLTVSLLISIGLNFILIPRWGIIGAAWTALVCNFIMAMTGFWQAAKLIPINHKGLMGDFVKTFFPALIMGIGARMLLSYFHFVIVIILAVIIYFFLLYLTGGFTLEIFKQIFLKIRVNRNPE